MAVLRKTWVTVVGWVLTIGGVGLLALPGPGLLTLVAGLAILSQEYEWAERRLQPVKDKAFEAAAAGVETWPRIMLSTLGALALIVVGIVWWIDPEIREIWFFGPKLPFAGWGSGLSIVLSGIIALGLLIYSIRRFRYGSESDRPPITDNTN
ncbi:MAG TPA: PGPGW domain-containing protein [Nocardioidaceae bacterium]|nr:PGPGW domain-containing protein [Nocardioidaceae bacterium]